MTKIVTKEVPPVRRALLLGLTILPLTAWLATPTSADRIHLKRGDVVDVESWRESGDLILYWRRGGEIGIPKEDVLRIERTEPTIQVPRQEPRRSGEEAWKECQPIPWVGEPEARLEAWLECLGSTHTRRRKVTATTSGTTIQHIIYFLNRPLLYIYTRGGVITVVQN